MLENSPCQKKIFGARSLRHSCTAAEPSPATKKGSKKRKNRKLFFLTVMVLSDMNPKMDYIERKCIFVQTRNVFIESSLGIFFLCLLYIVVWIIAWAWLSLNTGARYRYKSRDRLITLLHMEQGPDVSSSPSYWSNGANITHVSSISSGQSSLPVVCAANLVVWRLGLSPHLLS